MKIIPLDRIKSIHHSGYRGWLGTNPNIEVVDHLEDADFIWHCAWGDGDNLRKDVEEADEYGAAVGTPVIHNVTGDHCYVPSTGNENWYFNTTLNPDSPCRQVQVPYSYHDSLKWWVDSGRPSRVRPNLVCFRGSFNTNPKRGRLLDLAYRDIIIEQCDGWEAARKGEWGIIQKHNDLLLSSIFTFCPRGIGESSIRVAETIFRGSIPVLLDDDSAWFGDKMDFCIRGSLDGDLKALVWKLREISNNELELSSRLSQMSLFRDSYLLIDNHRGCDSTVGYTEKIREIVNNL